MSGLSRYEQETVINYNNGEKTAEIYSADPVVLRKLQKLSDKYPDQYQLIREDSVSKTYRCPKKLISFRSPCTRVYTEEEKAKMTERLRKYSEAMLG